MKLSNNRLLFMKLMSQKLYRVPSYNPINIEVLLKEYKRFSARLYTDNII